MHYAYNWLERPVSDEGSWGNEMGVAEFRQSRTRSCRIVRLLWASAVFFTYGSLLAGAFRFYRTQTCCGVTSKKWLSGAIVSLREGSSVLPSISSSRFLRLERPGCGDGLRLSRQQLSPIHHYGSVLPMHGPCEVWRWDWKIFEQLQWERSCWESSSPNIKAFLLAQRVLGFVLVL